MGWWSIITKPIGFAYNIANKIITDPVNVISETIDYIWLDNKIKIINSGPIRKKKEIDNKKFMPNKNFPSDHFMIYGEIIV